MMVAPYGLGTVAGGVFPGSSCYDPSHDNGEVHCASVADVLLSAANPFTQGYTTTCSAQEQACVDAAPTQASAGLGPATGGMPTDLTGTLQAYLPWIFGLVALAIVAPMLMGGRRR